MVTNPYIEKLKIGLEKLLLAESNYNLSNCNYEFIIFKPDEPDEFETKYTIAICSSSWEKTYRFKEMSNYFDFIKSQVEKSVYEKISSLSLLHSTNPLANAMRTITSLATEDHIEIKNLWLIGVTFKNTHVFKNSIIGKIKEQQIHDVFINNPSELKQMGIIKLNHNFMLTYFNNRGIPKIKSGQLNPHPNELQIQQYQAEGYVEELSFFNLVKVLK